MIFKKNMTFFLNLIINKQPSKKFSYSDFSRALNGIVHPGTISGWFRSGHTPTRPTLKSISEFFSTELDIPINLFEDGKALIEKDFENVLSEAHILPASIQRTSNPPKNVQSSAINEVGLINFLRSYDSGSKEIPLSSPAIERIMRMVHSLGGMNSEEFVAALELFQHWGKNARERRKESP